jgi:hypothetical protein
VSEARRRPTRRNPRSSHSGQATSASIQKRTYGLPDVFLTVELGCARRQRHERDVVGNHQGFSAMPAGLIKQYNGVRPGDDFGRDLVEMDSRMIRSHARQRTTPWIAGIGPSSTRRARKASCMALSLGGTPAEGILMRPSAPCSLKRITQSRSV